jgi:hypothetical protein
MWDIFQLHQIYCIKILHLNSTVIISTRSGRVFDFRFLIPTQPQYRLNKKVLFSEITIQRI